jgi:hypothetical protein
MCENCKKLCLCKIHGLENVKMAQKVYILFLYKWCVFFMMFWYEINTIYILIKFV